MFGTAAVALSALAAQRGIAITDGVPMLPVMLLGLSVLFCQWIHVSSTKSLVIFRDPRFSAAQEVLWSFLNGLALWVVVAVLARKFW